MSRNRKAPNGILERAKRIADAGDRWFVSLAGGLGKAVRRVRDEAAIVADSAQKAAATTREVGKGLKGKLSKGRQPKPDKAEAVLLEQLGALVLEHADELETLCARPDFEQLVRILRAERPGAVPDRPSRPPSATNHGSVSSIPTPRAGIKAADYRPN